MDKTQFYSLISFLETADKVDYNYEKQPEADTSTESVILNSQF